MNKLLIANARLINEGRVTDTDVMIRGERIEKVAPAIRADEATTVHFREPGLTHKGDLATESAAAAAGGITSFMDMPNVNPLTTSAEALAAKYAMAEGRCTGNYGFYLGATNSNIDEIKRLERGNACGIKVFMGASTGDMLVDDAEALDQIFRYAPVIVVTHCEDSPTIWANETRAQEQYGEDVPMSEHPNIRSAEACLKSSQLAVELATKHDALLHVLHLTTAVEMQLFSTAALADKRVTAEVCVHHLWFEASDYDALGSHIKCNPAIKQRSDRDALVAALNDGRIDVIATDHAPHTLEEKENKYFKAPSGLPLVQHAVLTLFDLASTGRISYELLVEKACHAPADLFGVGERGYVREGWYADLVIVDAERPHTVVRSDVLSKCGWSPFEGHTFSSTIDTTIINGNVVYRDGKLTGHIPGQRLKFGRAR